MRRAVVLLSGGLDSATTLALAREQGFVCHALSFAYGQRHGAELDAAARVAKHLGAEEHRVYSLSSELFGGSALTDAAIAVPVSPPEHPGSPAPEPARSQHLHNDDGQGAVESAKPHSGIPVTYVPARNTVFLSLALAWAEALGARDLFIGANAVDYPGYPDCRPEFLAAFETVANLATRAGVAGERIRVHAPLVKLSKAGIIRRGAAIGVDYSLTVSCYRADAAGRACGRCDSCRFRARGFSDAGVPDPTPYV